MSLIERAVSRLAGAEPPPPAEGKPGAPPATVEKRSTIEAFVDRASQGGGTPAPGADTPSPAALAPVSTSSADASLDAGAARIGPLQPEPTRPQHTPAGQIHLETLRARGFVVPDGQPSQLSHEFRVIKRPLIANAFGKGSAPVRNGKRVMITSAFPGEGKTFCAINLALSIAAERDHKVLLVDADVARPSIPRRLGFEAGAGLMDWLVDGNLDVAQLVIPTNIDKLAVLPAGRKHEQATEFLASASMTRLLEQISARFPDRLVIFDSPPLLVTTESRVLASYMGQVVVVVEAGKTPRPAVTEALATVEGAEVVGMVLNKAKGTISGGYGGYYGYGGYGYGSA